MVVDKVSAVGKISDLRVGVDYTRAEIQAEIDAHNAQKLTRERALFQGIEVLSIATEAQAIWEKLEKEKIPIPSVYAIFTGGFTPPPEKSRVIGHCGKEEFAGFYESGIVGQSGEISIVDLGDGKTMLALNFRTHPYDEFGSIAANHNARVIIELIRLGRAKGIDAAVITTYLSGIDYQTDFVHPGEIAIFVDDTEKNNQDHPGFGAHGIFNEFIGPQFGAKAGRSSDPDLAANFLAIAAQAGFNIAPAVLVGTQGATEFQSLFERAEAYRAFKDVLKMPLTKSIMRFVFGKNWRKKVGLLFGMGPTMELANFRATFPTEKKIRVLALGLATDEVGSKQSLTIHHGEVFANALASAGKYMPSIIALAQSAAKPGLSFCEDYSISLELKKRGIEVA